MLRALKRLLRRGGRIAFTTIDVRPGLDEATRRRAHRAGPRAVASRASQGRLLASAGFVDLHQRDVTAAFTATTRAWIEERERHAGELAGAGPPGSFEQRQQEYRAQLAALEEGLLRRWMLAASRP